jgi:translation initiation factor 2B subunit (eIF-2B alpha/beta/delta family)
LQWELLVEPIRTDKTSGATELARKAATAILEWMEHAVSMTSPAWKTDLLAFARALYRAQPAMAPLFNLVNNVLLALESATVQGEVQPRVQQTAQAFLDHGEGANQRLATATLGRLPSHARVLTFSYSSSVLAVLLEAHARQCLSAVFCTESRPIQEGQRLARTLANAGIAVEFGVDAAITTLAQQAHLVLVGADSLTIRGVINKLGTTGLALVARHVGIPSYVICDRHKWLPAAATVPEFSQLKPGAEVWPDPPEGVTIRNAYFECTPTALFSGIIGEDGLLASESLLQQLIDMPIAQALRPRVRQSQG